MSIPDSAIKAGAQALRDYEAIDEGDYVWDTASRNVIEAAMPAIREAIAQEIEAEGIGADAGRNPMTGQESPDAPLHAAHNDGIQAAAHIVREGRP